MIPITAKGEIRVVGIQARTSNQAEFNPTTAKIGKLWQKFIGDNIPEKIPNAVDPGTRMGVYSDYGSDEDGSFTVTVGLQVSRIEKIPPGLVAVVITPSKYAFIRTPRGRVPDIVIEAWQKIRAASEKELGGQRSFAADFEVYDERSCDMQNASVDIYVGLR